MGYLNNDNDKCVCKSPNPFYDTCVKLKPLYTRKAISRHKKRFVGREACGSVGQQGISFFYFSSSFVVVVVVIKNTFKLSDSGNKEKFVPEMFTIMKQRPQKVT